MVESLFNKATRIQASNFIKKRLHRRYFPAKFTKFLRTHILKNNCERLLLKILSNTLLMSKSRNVVILLRMNGLILLYSDLPLTCYWKKVPLHVQANIWSKNLWKNKVTFFFVYAYNFCEKMKLNQIYLSTKCDSTFRFFQRTEAATGGGL